MPDKKPRVVEMVFRTRDEFIAEWNKNISKGGIFMKIDPPPSPRERLNIAIAVEDINNKFILRGEAVHIAPQGVGIHLDSPTPELAETIRKIIAGEFELASDEDSMPAMSSETEPAQSTPPAQTPQDAPKAGEDETLYRKIQNMSRAEKASLARKGTMDARNMLIRDRDPYIVMSVLQNPGLTIAEIIQLSKSQGLTLDMIKHISNQADWMANEDVRFNIVVNPKTPQPTAMGLLKKLSDKNLRLLAKRPGKQSIKSAALKLVLEKQGVRK